MELRHLRYFVAVAEELHFGHAANRLNTSQPSLSQQIRDLERELKVDLFLRTKRRVALTPAGQRFLHEARGILSSAERAAGVAREAARGESLKLAVGISPETDWIFLGKALRLFAEHTPSVEIVFQNLTPQAQVGALRGGQIDVGFVGLPLEAEGMVTETTGRVRLVVALPENHPMARKNDLKLEELSKETYMLWPRHLSPGSYDQLLSVFRRAGFRSAGRHGRRASLNSNRSRHDRGRPDDRPRRPGPGADVRGGSRLSSSGGPRHLHRKRGHLPAIRCVADPRFLPSRTAGHASPAPGHSGRCARPEKKAPGSARGLPAAENQGLERLEPCLPGRRSAKDCCSTDCRSMLLFLLLLFDRLFVL